MESMLFLLVLGFISVGYCLDQLSAFLNLGAFRLAPVPEFRGRVTDDAFSKSRQYCSVNTWFGFLSSTFSLFLILGMIFFGGFNVVDQFIRSYFHPSTSEIMLGLAYIFSLYFGSSLLNIPFSLYKTFVIEAKFGFNQMTLRTFFLDYFKGGFLSIFLGGGLLSALLWFFSVMGASAWVWCWILYMVFQGVMMIIAPLWIMPLFNRFEPLDECVLKTRICACSKRLGFDIEGVYVMDGSRRSTKANAFFSGFGASRRIVFYDTLIKNHSVDELAAIFTHEVGHYKHHHMIKGLLLSGLQGGVMFYVLDLVLLHPGLFQVFSMSHHSIYASFVFFGFLYLPLGLLIGLFGNYLSQLI